LAVSPEGTPVLKLKAAEYKVSMAGCHERKSMKKANGRGWE
jgi:hypothetical protein